VKTSRTRTDVVVVGAGIIGASVAWHLADRGRRVTVLEALAGPAEGSTGRSFSCVRGQWADPLNTAISWQSIQRYRGFPKDHGVDLGYRPIGYLFLVPEAAWPDHLAAVELQRSFGVPVEVMDPTEATRLTPFATDGIAGATFGPADGVVDPHLATSTFLELARTKHAEVFYRHPVTAIEAREGGDGWIVTAADRRIETSFLVNAAGGWAADVAALAGLSVPIVHSRRNIFASAPDATSVPLPMTIDVATGAYLRSEGTRVLFGAANPGQVDGYNVAVDWPWLDDLLPVMAKRFPWLEDVGLDRGASWAGTYENTPDYQPILGADPAAPTWVNACGLSGRGVMQAPEIGRLVAEHIVEGSTSSLDTKPFRLERFTDTPRSGHVEMAF
jgi:sarcosine oxidase subunit beta